MEDGKPRVHFLDDETTAMVVAERPSSSRSTDSTTLREEERMLVHLKKENFDLKMKIFYMTERLKRSGVRDSEEDLAEENVQQKMLIDEKDREITHRNRLLVQAKSAIDALKTELMETKSRVVELESERVTERDRKVMSSELERTRKSDESAREALGSLRERLSERSRQVAQHEVCARERDMKMIQMQKRLEERDSTIRSLRLQLKASSTARSKLEDRIVCEEASGERKIQIEALQAKIKSKTKQIRRLETECTKLHHQLMVRGESEDQKQDLESMFRQEKSKLERKHDMEITELVEAKRSVEKRLRDTEHRLELSSAECVELATLLESERKRSQKRLEETSKEARAELAQWAQKSVSWKSEEKRRNSMIEKNEAKVLKLQRRIADMCGRLEVMERSRQEAQDRLITARSQFENDLKEQRDTIAHTEDRVDEWKLRAQELEHKLKEQVQTESKLREQVRSQRLLQADMEKRHEIEEDETHIKNATSDLRRRDEMQELYEDLRDALGLAPSFSSSTYDFKPLLEEIRRGRSHSSSSSKQITREMCRDLEHEFHKRTESLNRYVDKFEDRMDGLEKKVRGVLKKKMNRQNNNNDAVLRTQLERYQKEVQRLRDVLSEREEELRASNDARDAAITKQMRVAENNRLLILEVKERGEDLKDDRIALKNAQHRIQSLQKRFHYLMKANEELKRRHGSSVTKKKEVVMTPEDFVQNTKATTTPMYPKSPWHSRIESVSSTDHKKKKKKGHRNKELEITPIPLRERSFNEVHSTMINNLGDLSRDLKRGASAILSSSPSLRRSGRRTRGRGVSGLGF